MPNVRQWASAASWAKRHKLGTEARPVGSESNKEMRKVSRWTSAGVKIQRSVAMVLLMASVALGASINESETFVLKGHTRPAVAKGLAQDEGAAPDTQLLTRLSLHFALTAAQIRDLNQLLSDLQNRQSAQYHRFLTSAEYAKRFGLNTAEVAKITRWLESNGFSDIEVAESRSFVSFSGSVAQAQAAFHTQIHNYVLKGEQHYANSTDPELPKALAGVADGIGGLNNFSARPHTVAPVPHYTAANGNHYLTPNDWGTIYDVGPLYSASLNVQNVKVIVVGQSDVRLADLRAFRSAATLPAHDPTFVTVGTDPGLVSGDELESDINLEWAGAIAYNVNVVYVTGNAQTGGGVNDALTYAVNNYPGSIIVTSYGSCEADISMAEFNTQNNLFAQANATGTTILVAAGNRGAADCDTGTVASQGLAVQFPASSPYVTAVGGTLLSEGTGTYWSSANNSGGASAQTYIPEVAWDDSSQNAGGGGASALVTKPNWQTGLTPSDGARDVPDVAFAASANHDGYLICSDGSCVTGFQNSNSSLTVVGGTAASSAAFAGVVAFAQAQASPNALGNINPRLYSISSVSSVAFHDIATGGNFVSCAAGSKNCPSSGQLGYSAVAGYDQATGLGSADANNLVAGWNYEVQATASPSHITLTPGSSATSTITLSFHPYVNGITQVAPTVLGCTVASTLPGVTCSVPPSLSTVNGVGTLTITAASNARSLPVMPLYPMCLLVVAVATLCLIRKQRPAVGLAFLLLAAVGCGSGNTSSITFSNAPTAQSESGTVTVTATLGDIVNTTTVQVTVTH